ncbi:PIN domain-containing protein [Herbaspirillum aquaticum]|uniref:Nucleic acid-binding protein n=1 Tax=Herbaspirillum aquaticum TaxID=568783 RepID=A0A225SRJ2_9BURK|nr:PIN domain-containing protein [Herbaspirillum aquaticum]OWY33701.1 nucleic acid-binding protein [Herbaspirillum aquaticum]
MIIFDANILISLATMEESELTYDRLMGLLQDLIASKTVIGVPAPAWAEFLCGTDIATSPVVMGLRKKSAIRILPFDEVAAFEAAFIHRGAMAIGKKKGAAKAPWQQVKIDRQILAIARQNQVSTIYTDDENMILEASRLGILTVQSKDIPLKQKQTSLDFSGLESQEAFGSGVGGI